jgi:bacterioferritin-associated ferredoxin
MYVCICNGLTERHVRDAAEAGALQPSEVYQAFGCEMQCGVCENAVACIVAQIAGPASAPVHAGVTGKHDVTFAGQAAAALS